MRGRGVGRVLENVDDDILCPRRNTVGPLRAFSLAPKVEDRADPKPGEVAFIVSLEPVERR